MNYVITNKQESIVDLAPLRDEMGLVLTLRPRGQEGHSKVVDQATASDEIVERVKKMGWVEVRLQDVAAPVPPAPPAEVPRTPEVAAPPSPVTEPAAPRAQKARAAKAAAAEPPAPPEAEAPPPAPTEPVSPRE